MEKAAGEHALQEHGLGDLHTLRGPATQLTKSCRAGTPAPSIRIPGCAPFRGFLAIDVSWFCSHRRPAVAPKGHGASRPGQCPGKQAGLRARSGQRLKPSPKEPLAPWAGFRAGALPGTQGVALSWGKQGPSAQLPTAPCGRTRRASEMLPSPRLCIRWRSARPACTATWSPRSLIAG